MWGEPREGTEAHKVKQLAEQRKKQARESGFDVLFTDVYYEELKGLKHRIEIGNGWENYLHPHIVNLQETEGSKENNYATKLSFEFNDNIYLLMQTRESWSEIGDGSYCNLDLYLDNKKVFGVIVAIDSDEYATTYRPSLITAYASDAWVTDFKVIQDHYRKAEKATEIAYAEDPAKTRKLKEEFGISDEELKQPQNSVRTSNIRADATSSEVPDTQTVPLTRRWWFWALIAAAVWMLF